VHTFDLVVKASSLSPEFNTKHFVARCSAVKRFMRANSLVYHIGTHETQRKPDDVALEASEYMNLMHPFLEGPHRD
jgi:fido (protein-threonine AMPylation protein)